MLMSDVETDAYDELLHEGASRGASLRNRSHSVIVESPRQFPCTKRPSSLAVQRSNPSKSVLSPSKEEPDVVRRSASKDENGRMPHRHSAPEIKESKLERKKVSKVERKDSKDWEL